MNEQVLEKIKKLLRNKGRTTEETETALFLAQKLAMKNGIDINSVNPDEPAREPITHAQAVTLARLQCECKYSAMIINRFFNVAAFVSKGIVFVGTKQQIEIARYVYNFLVRHFRREWKIKKGKLRNRQSFMAGMYDGLFHKLLISQPKIEDKEGIILISHAVATKTYIEEKFGQLKSKAVKPDKDSVRARARGIASGLETNIYKGLETNEQTKLLN